MYATASCKQKSYHLGNSLQNKPEVLTLDIYRNLILSFSKNTLWTTSQKILWHTDFIPFPGEAAPQGGQFPMELHLGRMMIWTQEYLIGELNQTWELLYKLSATFEYPFHLAYHTLCPNVQCSRCNTVYRMVLSDSDIVFIINRNHQMVF